MEAELSTQTSKHRNQFRIKLQIEGFRAETPWGPLHYRYYVWYVAYYVQDYSGKLYSNDTVINQKLWDVASQLGQIDTDIFRRWIEDLEQGRRRLIMFL